MSATTAESFEVGVKAKYTFSEWSGILCAVWEGNSVFGAQVSTQYLHWSGFVSGKGWNMIQVLQFSFEASCKIVKMRPRLQHISQQWMIKAMQKL